MAELAKEILDNCFDFILSFTKTDTPPDRLTNRDPSARLRMETRKCAQGSKPTTIPFHSPNHRRSITFVPFVYVTTEINSSPFISPHRLKRLLCYHRSTHHFLIATPSLLPHHFLTTPSPLPYHSLTTASPLPHHSFTTPSPPLASPHRWLGSLSPPPGRIRA